MKLMEQSSKRPLRIYTLAVCAVTVVAIVLRCLNLSFFFDEKIGYYQRGALLPTVETVLLWAAPIAFAVLSLWRFRRMPLAYSALPSIPLRIAGIPAAVLPIVYALLRVMTEDNSPLPARLTLVLSMVVAAYYMLHAANSEIPPLPRFVTGLGVILWSLAVMATSYFDVTVQMNAPDKLIFQFACLSLMLFTVSELRVCLGVPRSALYLFSAGCATVLMGTASIPTLILGLTGNLERHSWFWGNLILLGAFLYAVTRLLTLAFGKEEAPASDETAAEEDAPSEDVGESANGEESDEAEASSDDTPSDDTPSHA